MENMLKKQLNQVTEAVMQASHILDEAFTVSEKEAPANLVTSADIAVQKFLQAQLCALLPGSVFFGEEEETGSSAGEYVWIVDPIDGTANFSRGIGEYAISVALMHKEEVVLGVVYNPRQSKLFSAVQGQGALCNGRPIHVSDMPFSRGIFCTAMSLYRKEYAPQCMAVIAEAYQQCSDVRRFGSCALEICYLAEGICDLFFEFRVFPWDYAAAFLILKEAGGYISGYQGAPLTFDRTTPIIAANSAENFQMLHEIIKKHIPQIPYEEVLR